MRIAFRPAPVLAAALLALSLAACGSNATPAASPSGSTESDNGPLVVYSGRDEKLVGPLIAQFEKDTGIKTEVRYAGSAAQAQLLLTERDNSPAQVFLSQESGALGLLAQAGLLGGLSEPALAKVPEAYRAADKTWVGLTGRARVVAYDSSQVSVGDVPDTAAAMIDPKWKGQIGVTPGNASFIAFVTAMRLTDGEAKTAQWLKALADNGVKSYEKNSGILQAVESGEIKLGLTNHYYWFSAAAEQGADNMRAKIKYGAPGDVAALVNVTGVGLLKKAAQNPNAQAFVDYLLSEAGQKYFVEKQFEYPLVPGVAGPQGVPELASLQGPKIDLSDLDSVEQSAKLIDEAGISVG